MNVAAVAHHEAGHVVAALHLGRTVDVATIVPAAIRGRDSLGHVVHDVSRSFGNDIEACIILHAGGAAQRRYAPRSNVRAAMAGDLQAIDSILTRITRAPAVAQSARTFAKRSARDIITREWGLVEAIAMALLDRKTLAGDDLLAIRATHEAGQTDRQAAALAVLGNPDPETVDAWRAERAMKTKPFPRRLVAEAALLVAGAGQRITPDTIGAAAAHLALARGIDPDKAASVAVATLAKETSRHGWRPV